MSRHPCFLSPQRRKHRATEAVTHEGSPISVVGEQERSRGHSSMGLRNEEPKQFCHECAFIAAVRLFRGRKILLARSDYHRPPVLPLPRRDWFQIGSQATLCLAERPVPYIPVLSQHRQHPVMNWDSPLCEASVGPLDWVR